MILFDGNDYIEDIRVSIWVITALNPTEWSQSDGLVTNAVGWAGFEEEHPSEAILWFASVNEADLEDAGVQLAPGSPQALFVYYATEGHSHVFECIDL